MSFKTSYKLSQYKPRCLSPAVPVKKNNWKACKSHQKIWLLGSSILIRSEGSPSESCFSPFFPPILKVSAEFLKETLLNKGRVASFQILMEIRLQNIFSMQPRTMSSKSNNNSARHVLQLQSLQVLPDQQHCKKDPNLIQLL